MLKLITTFLVLIIFASAEEAVGNDIVVIVNDSNPITLITTDQLQDYFLKRARKWPDGKTIRFFDRSEESPLRMTFIKKYIKKTSRQIDQYWIGQKLYSGDSAPSQIATDAMTANLVSRFPGGIGYVSSQYEGAQGVKIIPVIGD